MTQHCACVPRPFSYDMHAADMSKMSYSEVLEEVCRVANWLKEQGVEPGDSVAIYMPMVLQLPISMLACARIGAVHSVVFGGFSAESLADRIADSGTKVLITASGVMRGKKMVPLKKLADEACRICQSRGCEVSLSPVATRALLAAPVILRLNSWSLWSRFHVPSLLALPASLHG
jgi:acyl-coenzyme A synthetase/AMP-(fatty) acid ligase